MLNTEMTQSWPEAVDSINLYIRNNKYARKWFDKSRRT